MSNSEVDSIKKVLNPPSVKGTYTEEIIKVILYNIYRFYKFR